MSACTSSAFGGDAIYPTAICVGRSCAASSGGSLARCDGETGVCVSTGASGVCLPPCSFDDAAVKGCTGKNGCVPHDVAVDEASGKPLGHGYCYAGCTTDGDCPTGTVCQTETMVCVKQKEVYAKKLGDACEDGEDVPTGATVTCDCLMDVDTTTGTRRGYCVQVCRVGGDPCPTGFTCDAGLEKSGAAVLGAQAAGLLGTCLKDCRTDTDCAPLNARCVEHAGVGKKTCAVGG